MFSSIFDLIHKNIFEYIFWTAMENMPIYLIFPIFE